MGWAKFAEDIRTIKDDNTFMGYGSVFNDTYSSVKTTSSPGYNSEYFDKGRNNSSHTQLLTVCNSQSETVKERGYVKRNYERNGIEIFFYRCPPESVRDKLKENHWRWHKKKKCWYCTYTERRMNFAQQLASSKCAA